MDIKLERIGCAVAVRPLTVKHPNAVNRRGTVRGAQSRFSRSRLRRRCSELAEHFVSRRCYFVTLTFSNDVSLDYAKRALRAYLRKCSGLVLWRAEYTQRGRIHFHLISDSVVPIWTHGRYEVSLARSQRAVMSYLSAEFTKRYQSSCDEHVGRWWGMVNRSLSTVTRSVCVISDAVWCRVRRLLRRVRRYSVRRYKDSVYHFDMTNFGRFWEFFEISWFPLDKVGFCVV